MRETKKSAKKSKKAPETVKKSSLLARIKHVEDKHDNEFEAMKHMFANLRQELFNSHNYFNKLDDHRVNEITRIEKFMISSFEKKPSKILGFLKRLTKVILVVPLVAVWVIILLPIFSIAELFCYLFKSKISMLEDVWMELPCKFMEW